MTIIEAIERCETTHAASFLLTAYLEHVRWHTAAATLPGNLLALPVRGVPDLTMRRAEAAALVSRCIGETGVPVALVCEIDAVLGAALRRLIALGDEGGPYTPSRPPADALCT